MDSLSDDLFDELWPGELDEESSEWKIAQARSMELAAAAFLAVADDPGYCCRAAGHFFELADPT